jgi:hypothetical protein
MPPICGQIAALSDRQRKTARQVAGYADLLHSLSGNLSELNHGSLLGLLRVDNRQHGGIWIMSTAVALVNTVSGAP